MNENKTIKIEYTDTIQNFYFFAKSMGFEKELSEENVEEMLEFVKTLGAHQIFTFLSDPIMRYVDEQAKEQADTRKEQYADELKERLNVTIE